MRQRTVGINIRVSEIEKRKMEQNARRCHLSVSAYLRKLGFEKEVSPVPQKEFHEIYRAVTDLKNNLNSLSEAQISRQLDQLREKILDVYLSEGRGDQDGCDQNLACQGQHQAGG